ncbi:MAG: hypothetical protein IPJ88_04790 [Myxococcales bacterium]|nr:MAG: hypothetical protein IPJ88_04790 [Myxococcales bacterium]
MKKHTILSKLGDLVHRSPKDALVTYNARIAQNRGLDISEDAPELADVFVG